jgi:hypothetical protein
MKQIYIHREVIFFGQVPSKATATVLFRARDFPRVVALQSSLGAG